jgi:uncharacterized protein YdhG (YjbR/CyaY superfamily)
MAKAPKNRVQEYIATRSPDARRALGKLRDAVRRAAPEAVEGVAYGVLGFKLDGRPLVYAGGFAHHVGFYPLTPAIRAEHAATLAKYETSTGTVRFPLDRALPTAFIQRMVKTRIKEVQLAATTKASRSRRRVRE